jgi:hypothetical protein
VIPIQVVIPIFISDSRGRETSYWPHLGRGVEDAKGNKSTKVYLNTTYMTSWWGSKTRIIWSTCSVPANTLHSQKQIGRMLCRVSRGMRVTKRKTKLQEVKMCTPVFSHLQYLLFCTHRYFVQPYGRTLNCAVTHSSVNGTDHDQLY